MSGAPTELVERLYRRLLQAARERDGGIAGPYTVADLYQHLIPYRGVRGELGVLELAQYEHALLRLLAGEGGFLRLLDEEAKRDVAAELRSTNPILGIYRDYAAVEVELIELPEPNGRGSAQAADEPPSLRAREDENRAREVRDVAELVSEEDEDEDAWELVAPPLPEMPYPPPRPAPADATRVAPVAPAPAPVPQAPATAPQQLPAGAQPPGMAAPPPPGGAEVPGTAAPPPPPVAQAPATAPPSPPPVAQAPATAPPSPAVASPLPAVPIPSARAAEPAATAVPGAGGTHCVACSQLLPDVAGLRFCPSCGTDQVEVPCARCATPIRGSWSFCIRCGARRPGPAPSA